MICFFSFFITFFFSLTKNKSSLKIFFFGPSFFPLRNWIVILYKCLDLFLTYTISTEKSIAFTISIANIALLNFSLYLPLFMRGFLLCNIESAQHKEIHRLYLTQLVLWNICHHYKRCVNKSKSIFSIRTFSHNSVHRLTKFANTCQLFSHTKNIKRGKAWLGIGVKNDCVQLI